jgi:iron complex transport system permease protein
MKPTLGAARLALSLCGATLFLLAVVVIAPLVGLMPDPTGGHRLAWLDLGVALRQGTSEHSVLFQARLPRVLAGAVSGAGLAASGVAFQALLRNPLAEPYTLGVSSGASLGAALAIRFGLLSALGSTGVALLAFAGAAGSVVLVWRLARVGRSLPPATLLLAGVTLALVCSAASMLIQYTATFTESYRILRWMMGGLDWIPASDLIRAAVVIAVGLTVLIVHARDLNALAAGADAAASVGVDTARTTRAAYGSAALVVGAVVAVAGPIGFVGLVVPHALRAVVGPDHRALLPVSILVGAAFVVVCDTLGRLVLAPAQLPVGVVTALLGGPFFLTLLVREKGRARLWGGG